jgi:predicted dehydrogenase
MSGSNRREFLKNSVVAAGTFSATSSVSHLAAESPNDRINLAVVGFNDRGAAHIREFSKIPGVRVAALCDIDERLFPRAVKQIEEATGVAPKTEVDLRRLLEDKDIHAISIATPDHWHALQTIWACQAEKDVYVEKPVSYTFLEGRRMVEAARKYGRVVQAGLQSRSSPVARAAMTYLKDGEFGRVYRSKAIIFKGRASIGRVKDSPVPKGVNWDLFLGPAPYRPYNENRFHYGWHFFWDTSTTDVGNSGVHEIDISRWGMGKRVHPIRIHCTGGYYQWDSDQETPNLQIASLEYEDGSILEIELTNLYTHPTAGIGGTGNTFYTSKGYVSSADGYQAYIGEFIPKGEDRTQDGVPRMPAKASFPERNYRPGPKLADLASKTDEGNHFRNFIDCVRSRRWQDLNADILEGHMSTSICHLANISFRTGRKLTFNPYSERFVNDEDANSFLTRIYREPYVLPDKV